MTKLRVMLLPALAATAVLACMRWRTGDGPPTATDELQTIEAGKLIVGSDIPYEPFEGGDAPDYEGFDIDIINGVAERLEPRDSRSSTPRSTRSSATSAQDKFDMVASATTITPEREKEVAFSSPYFQADQSLMVKEGTDIASVEDLAGRTIGAQKGTTGATYAEDETEAADVRTYPEIVRRVQRASERADRGRDQRLRDLEVRRGVEARSDGDRDDPDRRELRTGGRARTTRRCWTPSTRPSRR